jgi:hypothetical protein
MYQTFSTWVYEIKTKQMYLHYEKIMSIANMLSNCNLILVNIF